jgi:hypothetical protein
VPNAECAYRDPSREAPILNPQRDDFIATAPWFLGHDTMAKVGPSKAPGYWESASPAFTALFPTLGQVLKDAFVASIDLNASSYVLFTWQRKDKSFCSWLSPAPCNGPPISLYPDHQTLVASFGGIVERSNEPTWWVLNHNDVLTEREARYDATFIADYAWAFESASVAIRDWAEEEEGFVKVEKFPRREGMIGAAYVTETVGPAKHIASVRALGAPSTNTGPGQRSHARPGHQRH